MFDITDDASKREKCYTTVARLPAFVDPKQIPSKKPPFSTILNHPFVHTVELILPQNVYESISASLDAKLEKPQYARVFMSPFELLEPEFFNTYIKTGNILMISEGKAGSDNVFTLNNGTIKIELGKEVFERTGLPGKPIRSGGRKHGKERYLVELNLRLPSMLHGKKGFDKIVSAFKNVLDSSLAWLFCDLEPTVGQTHDTRPIQKLHPQVVELEQLETNLGTVLTPLLGGLLSNSMSEEDMQERCGALSEWVAMVQLGSPRVSAADHVDPYLSRYSVPESDETCPIDLVSLKWHGLISSKWIIQLFSALLGSRLHTSKFSPKSAWFILSASALGRQAIEGKDGFMIASAPNICSSVMADQKDTDAKGPEYRHAICWEFVGATAMEN
ncbi:hypothetical protein N7462_007669 [Penicillium macrosclerotiorum]|uniref:uncharacterized protein n=1 Tax=Penicillium macrosclerotiorum TaxID=303699 RepID=UPI0025489FB8|nr:uncharacterized protein N7462_007669 [Penicillium macrosclerotiorum]KAJ5679425.1 hypothetical protein N7462_007669 [Penicillium macrosclerotiorum]